MTIKKATLKGLRGNYQENYTVGEVVFRKYKKEWHIYTSATSPNGRPAVTARTIMAPNSIKFVGDNPELEEALRKAAKPISTINDKRDNFRVTLSQIEIEYDNRSGELTGYRFKGTSAEEIKTHEQEMKARKEVYSKIPVFGAFLGIVPSYKLTYELSRENN